MIVGDEKKSGLRRSLLSSSRKWNRVSCSGAVEVRLDVGAY